MSSFDNFPTIPAAAVVSLRRPVLISAALGAAGIAVTAVFGHPLAGVFGVVGLALGLLNTRLLQRSVSRATITENPDKRALGFSALGRLGVITLIGFALAVLFRPDGIGIFFGLALYQMIISLHTAVPVMKGLSQQ